MLPPVARLPLNRQQRFSGRRYYAPLYTLVVRPNAQSTPRFAFVVSKKVARHAVQRNLLKRQLRHAMLPLTQLPLSYDYLIILHPQAANTNFHALRHSFDQTIH